MHLKKLRLRGAIGLRNIGRDVTLDFEKFGSGTIALIGPNGSGKTTIVENLHPFPKLISRSGSLAEHFYLEDSCRDLTISLNGDEYSFCLVVDAIKKRVESYVYKNGQALNDGKRPSYNRIISELFGNPELYFKSVFSAQGDSGFLGLPAGRRKELFAELLGFSKLQILSDNAKQKAQALQSEIAVLESKLSDWHEEVKSLDSYLERARKLDSEIAESRYRRQNLREYLETLRDNLEQVRKKQAEQGSYTERIAKLKNLLEQLTAEKATTLSRRDKMIADFSDSINSADSKLQRLEKILSNSETIKEKSILIDQKEELTRQKLELVSELNGFQQKLTKSASARDKKIQALEHSIRMIDSDLKRKSEIAGQIDNVPCRENPEYVRTCPLLEISRTARSELTELTCKLGEEQKRKQKTEDSADPEKDSLKSQISEIGERLAAVKNSLAEVPSDLESTDWKKLERELETAQVQKTETIDRLAELHRRLDEDRSGFETRLEQMAESIEDMTSEKAELEQKIDLELDRINSEIQTDIEKCRSNITAYEDMILRQEREKSGLESEINRLNELKQKTIDQQKKLETLRKDFTEWTVIRTAFSRDGIQALELENAAPAITELANEFLAIFDNRFRVRIDTTRYSRDGKKQLETLDIVVLGPDGEQLIENMSGGERVWVMTSLQKAISVYLKQVAEREYQTMIADECDGPLDPERAQAFFRATEKGHQLTGSHHTIFITQRHDIAQQCNQRIELDPAGHRLQEVF